jgi:hypothetical protein
MPTPVTAAHHELLARAGFTGIAETDSTPEFIDVARGWIDQSQQHRDELVGLLGSDEFEERQRERHVQLRAVEDGLLRRSLYVARRPSR